MLQSRLQLTDNRVPIDESARVVRNISRQFSALRRHARLFTAFCLAGVAIGTIYLKTATPVYTATATILFDNQPMYPIQDTARPLQSPTVDPTEVDSQVEVLRSERIGMAVIRNLDLVDDPAFSRASWIDEIWATVTAYLSTTKGSGQPSKDADPSLSQQLRVLKNVSRNLDISHIAKTSVLRVSYESPDPARAAEIANAYTDAYMLEQMKSRVEAIGRAQSWLKQRSEEARDLYANADLAAQKFKANNNLVALKEWLDQQSNEMTTQLVAAEASTTQAQARYLRIKNIIDTHQTEAAVTESFADPVTNDLRTKYLDASKRMSDLEPKLGPTHIAVVNLKNTMNELRSLLFQELARVAQSYRIDYEVAVAREKDLTDKFKHRQTVAISANDAQVQLRQLEQKAQSNRTIYETYMTRLQQTQQDSVATPNTHVISAASPPLAPSHPRPPNVLAISLALGALIGAVVVRLRESMDRVFRTVEQVRDELGVDVLGMLPIVPNASFPQHVRDTMPPILRHAIDNPFSTFAETLRSARGAADLALQNRSPKIIGLVSLLPKEGKSTVAKNFASLIALQGIRTILVDADMRNPSLTRAMSYERGQVSQSGLSIPPLAELLKREPDSGLQVLPCIYAEDDPRVADGLSSRMLNALLQSSDQSFEYVVIDLPPMGPVVSARLMASAIDAFICVVEWGATSRGAIHAALSKQHSIKEKLLGVILNKVDMKKLKIYEHFDSDGYYHQQYENYYRNGKLRRKL